MTLIATALQGIQQWFDNAGNPLSNGSVLVTVASSSTHFNVYSDSALTTPLTQGTFGVALDSAGMAKIYPATGAYDVAVYDSNQVLVPGATVLSAENVAQTFLPLLGQTFCAGARGVTSGYTILATDYLVTVNSTGGANPCVINLPAATQGHQVTIQNVGTVPISITPHGSDSINALSASAVWTMPAAVSALQIYPSVTLYPDGTSNWRGVPAFPPSTTVTALASGVRIASGTFALSSGTATVVTGLTTITGIGFAPVKAGVPSSTGSVGIGYEATGGSLAIISYKADGSAFSGTESWSYVATGT